MERPKEIIEMGNFEPGTTGGVGEGSSSRDASGVEPRETMLLPERRIERVTLTLQKDEKTKGYFDPKVISIGPYHHENLELLQIGRRIKPIIAQLYVPISTDWDNLRKKILDIVRVARNCYVEGSTNQYSNEDFVEMMLLDGLFVLALFEELSGICNYGTLEELFRQLGAKDTYLAIADISMLVENQLPFQVLESLVSLKSEDNYLNKLWVKYSEFLESFWSKLFKVEVNKEFKFIRELDDERIDSKKPLHYFEFSWLQRNKFSQSIHAYAPPNQGDFVDWFFSFRSITELKAKGIRVRPSSDCDWRSIKFTPTFFSGLLEIYPILVNLDFIIELSNQIAFEYMPNNPNNRPTVAYVNFLKSLINSTEDVKELRAKNILFSPCTSDKEVVRMINDIPSNFMDSAIYAEVKQGIQKHYDNKAKTWIAELKHKYFSSPWTFIAFLAATTLLTTSVLQTYYTVNPRK